MFSPKIIMSKIFDEDSDSDIQIETNNEYAKNYDSWRKKEELNKLKTKYGDELIQEDSSSSSSDDDEVGVELTDQMEKQFFKTLSYLKNKDPRIYDENVKFFNDTNESLDKNTSKSKKDKPMFIKDYERKLILEKNGQLSESEDEMEKHHRLKSPTYVEEQKQIKDSFKKVLDSIENEDNDCEWGGMLKTRQKTKEEEIREEAEYKEWLVGQKDKLEDKQVETDLKPLKDYWNNSNLDEGEKFLRDYILKKKFLDKEDDDYIPTYDEIVHDSDHVLSEDEQEIEQQEEFEHKYNFRFEEPDQEFIKRYPRTMEHSLRKTDDKRKIKRAETKERKLKEKEEKIQDLKKLQELKRKEIEEKMQKLIEITGNASVGFQDADFDDDFDPELHDKRMQSLFNDEFYQGHEGEQKPQFPDIDEYLELDNWEKWNRSGQQIEDAPHCEDEDFNMDCDYQPSSSAQLQDELIDNSKSKGKKKRRRMSLFAKAVSQRKPVFDPNDKSYEEYLDEYYQFDCEDIIGDIPCRFKYRKVVPNSFGLTIEEILMANDRELNKWCSLKKAVQHRPDHVEKYDQIAYAKKANNLKLKQKILPSLFVNEAERGVQNEHEIKPSTNSSEPSYSKKTKNNEESELNPAKKTVILNKNSEENNNKRTKNSSSGKMEQKAIKKNKNMTDMNSGQKRKFISEFENHDNKNLKKKRSKKNKNETVGISDARLSAYGINPKKFKNKLKYKKN